MVFANSLNNNRQGLQKIDQMGTKDFIHFLREFLPLFKNNKLDLTKVSITEKTDGSAIRLVVINNDLFFESSYSGIVSWDKTPFPSAAHWIYKNLKTPLLNIKNKFKTDFKIIGELIWCKDIIDNNNTFTPIGTTYSADKFGQYGGLIIIDLKQIVDNNLINFDNKQFFDLTNSIKELSNNTFKFFSKQIDLQFNTSVSLNLDIQNILNLINQPKYNKSRFAPKQDKHIIDLVNQIKNNLLIQFESIINNTTGHFSKPGQLIEGLVITILNSGNEYGLFSSGYKQIKEKYWKYNRLIEQSWYNVLFNIFNNKSLGIIRKTLDKNNYSKYTENFNRYWDKFLSEIIITLNNLNNDQTIPCGTKIIQQDTINKKLKHYSSIKSWSQITG